MVTSHHKNPCPGVMKIIIWYGFPCIFLNKESHTNRTIPQCSEKKTYANFNHISSVTTSASTLTLDYHGNLSAYI